MCIINSINEVLAPHLKEDGFSGVILIKTEDRTLFSRACGWAHRGFKVANTPVTRFDTASITKLFTSVAILQLADKGLLKLEDKITAYLELKDTAISPEVTLYQLLTHTSGIGDDADEEDGEDYEELWKSRPNYMVRETEDLLPQFMHKPAKFAPGEGCRYNNAAYILLGLAVEKATGIKYRDYVRRNVFDKAGMKATEFVSMDGIHPLAAEGYKRVVGEGRQGVVYRKNIYSYPPVGSPDGGAFTTAEDLDRFIRAIKAGVLLSEKSTREIMAPKALYRSLEDRDVKMGYGFEFITNKENKVLRIQKDGCNPGVACFFAYYPHNDLTLSLLSNVDWDVWKMARELHPLLLSEEPLLA